MVGFQGKFLFSIGLSMLLASAVCAQDFRVETEIFRDKEKEPFAEHLTLFTGGVVYDFPLRGPEEITMFDPRRERFVILDTSRRVQTTLSTKDVMRFTSALEAQSVKDDSLVNPKLDETFDAKTNWLVLTSKSMTYRAKGLRPPDKPAVALHRQFADWYARLNTMRRGALPPFARLRLNESLAERGFVPDEVALTIHPKNRLTGRTIELRSKHNITWRLLAETDGKRIARVGEYLEQYETVSFETFVETTDVALRGGKDR